MKNELFIIGKSDLVKGFITAVITAFVSTILQSISDGTLPTEPASLVVIAKYSIAAGVAYVGKNWLTNSQDKFMKPEPAPTIPNRE